MQYFIFTYGFFLLTVIHNTITPLRRSAYIYYTLAIFVALAVGFRGNSDEYSRVFVLIPVLGDFFTGHFAVINEKGWIFAFVGSVVKTLGFNSQPLFLIFSSTAVLLHAFFYRKFTKYYYLAFLLYLCHEIAFKEWNGIRMGFASVLLLPMIYYLAQGKKIKFLIIAVFASLVQYVAILSLLLYFLNKKIRSVYLLSGLFIAILITKFHVIYDLVWFLDSIKMLPGIVSSYLRAESYVYDVGLYHAKTIQQFITLMVLIYLFGHKKNTSNTFNLLFNSYYLSTLFLIIFSELALFAFRFAGHFYSVEPILLTYIILSFNQKKIVANIMAIGALLVAYLNYVVEVRVPPYDLFVN